MQIDARRVTLGLTFLFIGLAGCSSSQSPLSNIKEGPPLSYTSPTPAASGAASMAPTTAPTTGPTTTPTTAPTSSAITITYYGQGSNAVSLPNPNGLGNGTSGCPTSSYSQTFTASETGVTSFTAVSQNPSQVTVSPASGTTFTATEPTSNTNTTQATILISDGRGNSTTAKVDFDVACLS